jgi:hypothetical protein
MCNLISRNKIKLMHFLSRISFTNSHVDKLFGKQKGIGYFITVGVIVRRDDGRGTVVKRNDGGGWSSDGVVL